MQKYISLKKFGMVLLLAVSLTQTVYAQMDSVLVSRDSLVVESQAFTLDDFFGHILTHHPLVRRANLFNDLAFQDLRMARGRLDPVAQSDFNIKEFDNKRYYRTWDSKLKIPMWFPIDLEAGYERNSGEFLDESQSTPSGGLIYAGFSLPIGRGLFIDQRRAAIRQARLMQDLAQAEQIKEINKLLFDAAKAYWDWYYSYREYEIISEVENVALQRYNGVVKQVINGDVAPFDSLKAFINYQERDVQRVQAQLDLENARLAVSVYLWATADEESDQSLPLELAEATIPLLNESEAVSIELLAALQELAMEAHPELRKLAAKFQQTEIDRRLALEFLKPQIDLKYNFLSERVSELGPNGSVGNGDNQQFFFNDYKAGVQFYFPLFLRKERGKLAQTNIKLEQLYFEQSYQRQIVANEVLTTYNTVENLGQIIVQQSGMVNFYQQLLDGELRKFEFGESSIFLINTRETELLDARVKLLKFKTQREKSKAELYYAAGVPNLDWEISETGN
ncbi:MAG: TolC family protein [Tunicatimonas sp.]|uniref:TolC family protein n=1 Tax=Tunicatimonas sp. TaxID=1940096 RepID=UPI003C75E78B